MLRISARACLPAGGNYLPGWLLYAAGVPG